MRELTKEELLKWTKNPNISPYTGRAIKGTHLTCLTSMMRDECIKNNIMPPCLKSNAKVNSAEDYRKKVYKEKIEFINESIEKTLDWIKAGNEWKGDEETMNKIGINLKSNVFASKV